MSTHIPVLLSEMIQALSPCAGEIYVDGTFGQGGYSRAILEAAPCRVIGIDRDPLAIQASLNFQVLHGCFSAMKSLLNEQQIYGVNGIVLDIGVSSLQLDQAERGFSFRNEGPLDMRMSQEGLSAADIVNTFDETRLADILWKYGEERRSRFLARKIVEERRKAPLQTTFQLAEIVYKVLGKPCPGFINPATRTFQALRIFVNQELDELTKGLEAAKELLTPGGRLVVVTFHSLEDRIVKTFLAQNSTPRHNVRHRPDHGFLTSPAFTVPCRKPILPTREEIKSNPRARSAKLRWGIKE